jgi:hypothetical protein
MRTSKVPFYQSLPNSEIALLVGKFPNYTRLSVYLEQPVDKDECGASVELY